LLYLIKKIVNSIYVFIYFLTFLKMKILLNLVINALIVMVLAYILPGVTVDGFFAALVTALVIAFVGAFIGPILFWLTLPLNVLTLGLFTFVLMALLVQLASFIVPGFNVEGFWPSLIFAIVISLVSVPFNPKAD